MKQNEIIDTTIIILSRRVDNLMRENEELKTKLNNLIYDYQQHIKNNVAHN